MVTQPTHAGHRKRLRQRLLKSGIASLHDYEVLELLLSYIRPRCDTKALAKALVKEFGSVSGVLNADPKALGKVGGIGERTLAFVQTLNQLTAYCLKERLAGRSVVLNRRSVEQYLRFAFGSRRDEYVAVLFLDSASKVIDAEVVAEGTVNQCVIYPRVVVEKALAAGAAALIIAHNHPAGSPEPSEADWTLTSRLAEVGALLDLPLLDHVIVSRSQVVSLREHPRWPQ